MQSWSKLIVVWLLAVLLPIQSIAAMVGHCGEASAQPGSAVAMRGLAQKPCAQHPTRLPTQKHDGHAEHAGCTAGCAACCAALAAQVNFDATTRLVVTKFPPVVEHFARFVPQGLKRPPSAL